MPWNYPPYDALTASQKAQLIHSYRTQFTDFDNDIITYSVATVLLANNINNFQHIKVGATRHGQNFDLAEQLTGKLDVTKRFTYFSLPTRLGTHSVAVVFDHAKNECYVIDSLGVAYREAEQQLTGALAKHAPQYSLIVPRDINIIQQRDNVSCGIHTAANIVGIITGDIDLRSGKGIARRSPQEVDTLLGTFKLAYDQQSALRDQERFASRQRRVLRFALSNIINDKSLSINETMQGHINELISCLQKEQNEEKARGETSCCSFNDFIQKIPQNNPLLSIIVTNLIQDKSKITSDRDNIDQKANETASAIAAEMLAIHYCEKNSSYVPPAIPEPSNQPILNKPAYSIMFKVLLGVMITGITLLLVACLIALNALSLGTATIPTAIGVAAVGGGLFLTGGVGLFWNNRNVPQASSPADTARNIMDAPA